MKKKTLFFKKHCTKIDISLVVIHFFSLKRFIDILDGFCLLIFIFILRILKFIQCLYASYIKTSKVLIRFNGLFIRFSSSKCCFLPSYFYEKILPVNKELLLIAKITPGLNTCRCLARAAQFSAC